MEYICCKSYGVLIFVFMFSFSDVFAAFFSKVMNPPEDLTIVNALDTLKGALALEESPQRGKYYPTIYGRLLASLPLSLESSILVVRGGQLGFLKETAVLGAMIDLNPLPIVNPFGHELQVSLSFLCLHC